MAEFLSDDYMAKATEALTSHPGFTSAISSVDLGVQFVVSDHPEGELQYYLDIAGGSATMTRGTLDGADVSITNTYETAAGISKGEINTQMAFMTGKIKVGGNMAKIMMNQAVLNQFAAALSDLEVEYLSA